MLKVIWKGKEIQIAKTALKRTKVGDSHFLTSKHSSELPQSALVVINLMFLARDIDLYLFYFSAPQARDEEKSGSL